MKRKLWLKKSIECRCLKEKLQYGILEAKGLCTTVVLWGSNLSNCELYVLPKDSPDVSTSSGLLLLEYRCQQGSIQLEHVFFEISFCPEPIP
jgi:hypothetical protein